jgi:hypothetical protein
VRKFLSFFILEDFEATLVAHFFCVFANLFMLDIIFSGKFFITSIIGTLNHNIHAFKLMVLIFFPFYFFVTPFRFVFTVDAQLFKHAYDKRMRLVCLKFVIAFLDWA